MFSNLLYYGFHSFINQVKKIFNKWILIFFVGCFALGAMIGFIAVKIDDKNIDTTQPEIVDVMEDKQESLFDGIDKKEFIEAISGVAIIGLFVISIVSKTNEKCLLIFNSGDVGVLFTSPMTPQSVLIFRMLCMMGIYIFFTFYLMIEIPTIKSFSELTSLQAAFIVVAACLAFAVAAIFSSYVCLTFMKHQTLRKFSNYIIFGLVGAFAIGFVLYYQNNNLNIIQAAVSFFNSRYILYIPLIGWLKAVLVFAIEGNLLMSCVFVALNIISIVVILLLTKRVNVDYYEDAMKKTEEITQLANKIKETGTLFVRKKKTDKNLKKEKKIIRNELNHGNGAQMFMVRPLYNRFRFAKFKVFTKTLLLYLFVGAIGIVVSKVAKVEGTIIIPALIITVLAFYRTLGNPLKEDIENIYFLLAPQKASLKLMYSILAGTVNCLLDALPILIIGCVVLKASVLELLGWLFLIATMDFFATSVSAFMNLSFPKNAGTTAKQIFQLLFVYFGLIIDIIIAAIGMIKEIEPILVFGCCAFVNLSIGLIFFIMSSTYIEPLSVAARTTANKLVDLNKAKKTFTRASLMVATTFVLLQSFGIGASYFLTKSNIEMKGILTYLVGMLPLYVICMPIGYLFLRKAEKKPPGKNRFGFKRFIKFAFIMCFVVMTSSFVANIISMFLSALFDIEMTNNVVTILDGQNLFVQILFVVLIGPIMEEIFFRKVVIDHLLDYGEVLAIAVSAVLFGLFHANLAQTLYTTVVGLLLGYVYVKSGNLLYTIALHMSMNLIHGVVPLTITNYCSTTTILIYEGCLVIAAIAGFVIFFKEKHNIRFETKNNEIEKDKRFSVGFVNIGMLLLAIASIAIIVVDFISF